MSRVQACRVLFTILATACPGSIGCAQTPSVTHHDTPVPLQPFAVLARRVETALEYLGQPLALSDRQALAAALANADERAGVTAATAILDRYALVHVHINPESRVKVTQGAAAPALVQAGTRVFLVRVVNEAGITAALRVTSPQSRPVSVMSRGASEPPQTISRATSRSVGPTSRLFDKQPMTERLSGLPLSTASSRSTVAMRDRWPPTCRLTSVRARRTSAFAATSPWSSPPRRHAASRCGSRTRRGVRRWRGWSSATRPRACIPRRASAWRPTCPFNRRCTAATANRWPCPMASSPSPSQAVPSI